MAKQSEWDSMRIKGWAKFIHSLYMFITWPLRKPLYFVILVVLLLVFPLFFGAKLSNPIIWYKNKFNLGLSYLVNTEVVKNINEKYSSISNSVDKILHRDITKEEVKPQKKFVSWNVAEFNKVKYKPKQYIKNDLNDEDNSFFFKKRKQDDEQKENDVNDYVVSDDKLYVIKPDLNLNYLNEPLELRDDKVTVVDENSLMVDNKFVFLYGIYTNLEIYNAQEAIKYLEYIIYEKEVICKVVAQTKNGNIATALCFVDNLFINAEMVKNKLAKNVALNM